MTRTLANRGMDMSGNSEISRRCVMTAATMLAGAAMLPRRARAAGKLRIGFLNTFSKGTAFAGESNWNGFNLFLKQNGGLAGREVELTREDDEFNPQVGLEKIKKLVERDQVELVVGVQGSNVAMALLPYLRQSKTFLVCSGAGTSALSQQHMPYLFRTSLSTVQIGNPMADYIYDNISHEVLLSAADYAGGRDTVGEFKAAFLRRGGSIIKEIYPPLGAADYSAYLADIRSINPPATYHFYASADAVRFVKQWADFGLQGKIPLAGYASMVDVDTIPGQGRAAIGTITGNIYAASLDTPENHAFVTAYRAAYNDDPNLYSNYGYNCARVLHEALKQTKGEAGDKDALSKAIANVAFTDPRGPYRMDPVTHNPIQNVYVLRADDQDGKVVNKVIKTIADVRDPGVKA
jgi:branched-chain amino acid transport system substrate-binding protein